MRSRTAAVLVGGAVALAVTGSAGLASATGASEGDQTALTGEPLRRAGEVALAHVGQGSVTETEAGDEEGAYEVEVTRDDGREVDVHLREDFTVVGAELDTPGADDA